MDNNLLTYCYTKGMQKGLRFAEEQLTVKQIVIAHGVKGKFGLFLKSTYHEYL